MLAVFLPTRAVQRLKHWVVRGPSQLVCHRSSVGSRLPTPWLAVLTFGRAAIHGRLAIASSSVAAGGLVLPSRRTVHRLLPPYFVAIVCNSASTGSTLVENDHLARAQRDLHCNKLRARSTWEGTDF